MSQHVTDSTPLGYQTCRNPACGRWVVNEIARKSGGYCSDCFVKTIDESGARKVELLNAGARAIKTVRASKNRHRYSSSSNSRAREKAASRALRRLRALFPEIYDMLLAEERVKEGLDAWPIENVIRSQAGDPSETFKFISIYADMIDQGVDVDAEDASPEAR